MISTCIGHLAFPISRPRPHRTLLLWDDIVLEAAVLLSLASCSNQPDQSPRELDRRRVLPPCLTTLPLVFCNPHAPRRLIGLRGSSLLRSDKLACLHIELGWAGASWSTSVLAGNLCCL